LAVPLAAAVNKPHGSDGRARAHKLDTPWYDEVKRGARTVLEPISYYGLQARLNSAAKRAGITLGRKIHGARHHAGTTVLRKTGDLRLAQKLLGHADIKSTMKYAHALDEDLRRALGAEVEEPAEEDAVATRESAKA
jgi:integrase